MKTRDSEAEPGIGVKIRENPGKTQEVGRSDIVEKPKFKHNLKYTVELNNWKTLLQALDDQAKWHRIISC